MRLAYPALFDRFPNQRLAMRPDEVPTKQDAMAYGVHRLPSSGDYGDRPDGMTFRS
jgi:hypothetical protein